MAAATIDRRRSTACWFYRFAHIKGRTGPNSAGYVCRPTAHRPEGRGPDCHAACFVVEHWGPVYIQPAPPDSSVPDPRLVNLGDDEAGRAVEVTGVETEVDANGEDQLRVIHAMSLRDKYRGKYEEAKRWRV